MRLSFDPERPIYQQIIDEFKRAVARGELKPGDRIPSQRDLALQARVNPNTVQRAYREMEWMGLVETVRGQGTFVSGEPSLLARLRAEMAEEAVRRFVGEMRALGFVPEEILDWVRRGVVAAGDPAEGAPRACTSHRSRPARRKRAMTRMKAEAPAAAAEPPAKTIVVLRDVYKRFPRG